ncbi:MAG TPA: hypothetical protein VFJ58_09700 [Armatimonadota bacterium]|nr:hypothetical protein [Armatimonadota bacterium]
MYVADLPIATEGWLETVLDHYRLFVRSGGDGSIFVIYSRSPIDSVGLTDAVLAGKRSIESNEWFRQNYDRLRWDMDEDLCLKATE